MSFGGRLRALRQEATLARRAGTPARTLRHWESGRGFPTAPAFLRLAKALGVPAERFAEGVEDPAEGAAGDAEATLQRARKRRTS